MRVTTHLHWGRCSPWVLSFCGSGWDTKDQAPAGLLLYVGVPVSNLSDGVGSPSRTEGGYSRWAPTLRGLSHHTTHGTWTTFPPHPVWSWGLQGHHWAPTVGAGISNPRMQVFSASVGWRRLRMRKQLPNSPSFDGFRDVVFGWFPWKLPCALSASVGSWLPAEGALWWMSVPGGAGWASHLAPLARWGSRVWNTGLIEGLQAWR